MIKKVFLKLREGLFGDILNAKSDRGHIVAFSVSTGLFWCFTPTVFFQQAAIGLYWAAVKNTRLKFNFPIAWAWTWWSNPLTVAPLYYFYYKVGGAVSPPGNDVDMVLDFSSLEGFIFTVEPFILQLCIGSFLVSLISAFMAYFVVLWCVILINRYADDT